MSEQVHPDLKPEELEEIFRAERLKRPGLANKEIRLWNWKLDADHARRIYECCRTEPGHLDFYLERERAMGRLFPAVLGAFAGKCALCGWDENRRDEIRKALKSAEGVMFPIPELDSWVIVVEDKLRSCAAGHSGLEIWRLMRMLRVKVEEPKAAKIETAQYD
jgi:hypothetical protein